MAGFLYYVPTDTPPTRERLHELGFPHAHIASLPGRGCSSGPDGKNGYVFALTPPKAAGAREPTIGYYDEEPSHPNHQEWLECDNGKFFMSFAVHDRPTPLDLQNKQSITGEFVTLADGNDWKIPVIRNIDGTPGVESVLRIKPDGAIAFDKPAPQYMRVWDLAQRLWNQNTDPKSMMSEADLFLLIVDVMSLNYRVSKWEVGNLDLFTDENLSEVFKVIVGAGGLANDG